MSDCYPEAVVAYARSQKGTKEGPNNWNPYAKELDAVGYFNPMRKQNLPWCCTYVDDCVYNGCGKDKAKAQEVLYQPSYDNLSAVVKYLADYFKKAGAWTTNPDEVEIGDVVCFNAVNDKGQVTSTYTHTGLVIDRDERGITTSEGNRWDKVSECQYLFTSIGTKIAGFGKPKYDKKPSPEPQPTPDPKQYTVKVNSFLSLRTGPDTSFKEMGRMYNGAVVTAVEESGNWIRISGDLWCSKTYLK